jgi:hypothetical protein
MDEDNTNYSLLLSLDGQTTSYVQGFEAGRLWEQLKNTEPFEQTIHAANMELVMRMMEKTGRNIAVEDTTDDTWCHLVVSAAEHATTQP